MRQGKLHRWFAVFLLMFACADISADLLSPALCCEELGGLATVSTASITDPTQVFDGVIKLEAANNSKRDQPSSPKGFDEECFCCCTHIILSLHFDLVELDIVPPSSDFTNAILPLPPLQSPYHPPRLS